MKWIQNNVQEETFPLQTCITFAHKNIQLNFPTGFTCSTSRLGEPVIGSIAHYANIYSMDLDLRQKHYCAEKIYCKWLLCMWPMELLVFVFNGTLP